jgi:hypothetical protein
MRAIAALIALAILASGSATWALDYPFPRPDLPARAKPNWPPRIEEPGVRRVATFTGPEDSTCIGRPTTPECAIDSYMACKLLANWQACTTIGRSTKDILANKEILKRRDPTVVDYRIDIIGPLAPYRVEARLMDIGFKTKRDFIHYFKRGWTMEPGDLFAIVSDRWCTFWSHRNPKAPSWDCYRLGSPRDGLSMVFQLRHVRGFWTVVDTDHLTILIMQYEMEDEEAAE